MRTFPRTPLRRTLVLAAALALCIPMTIQAVGAPLPGTRLWVEHYAGTTRGSVDEALALTTSPDGARVYVAGYSSTAPGGFAVLAYRARTGERLWRGTFPFADGQEIWGVSDVVATRDRVVATVALLDRGDRMAAVAFDADTGHAAWLWTNAHRSDATGLATNGGMIVVAGNEGPRRNGDRVVVGLRAASGRRVWHRIVRDDDGNAYAESLAVDRGIAYVTGGTETATGWNVRTTAYAAADGGALWNDTIGGLSSATIAGLTPDGAVLVVAGTRWGTTTVDRWGVVRYDTATGTHDPLRTLDPAYPGDVLEMTADADASTVFFAGVRYVGAAPDQDAAVAAVDVATGDPDWAVSPDDGPDDGVVGVVASATEPVLFATGYTATDGDYDWRTSALDQANGAELWSDVYARTVNGTGFPRAVAVDRGGVRVFVGGYTDLWRHDDFTTIAYAA
jgi:outer membrane protein assembly factor BamB